MEERFLSRSPEETEAFGEAFARTLRGGEVLALFGEMGAGKTAFTRGLVRGLGGGEVVSSPTFALVNEYGPPCRLTVEHFDMFRVEDWDSLYSTGFFDYLDGERVLIIEWSENIEAALPEDCFRIVLRKAQPGENTREIQVTGGSPERGNGEC